MNQLILISVLLLLSVAAYQMGRRRAFRLVDGQLRARLPQALDYDTLY